MKYLCVAEKNDAAKKISGFLSNGGTRRVSFKLSVHSRCFLIINLILARRKVTI